MVLETLAAVSLASSIFQFITFATKLISKGNQYYKSTDGSLEEHVELQTISDNLGRLSKRLSKPAQISSAYGKELPEEKALKKVALDCENIAKEYSVLLDKLRLEHPRRVWKSFRQAAKLVWHKNDVDRMCQRLRTAREDVAVHLLVVVCIRQQTGEQSIFENSKQLENNVLKALQDSIYASEHQMSALLAELRDARYQAQPKVVRDWQLRNHDTVINLSNDLMGMTIEDNRQRLERYILDNLHFPQLFERYTRIVEAHVNTFQWILEEGSFNSAESYSDYVRWLLSSDRKDGLYWITGKPGSGKSTLMKFLYDDKRMKEYLRRWSCSRHVVSASCFFWNGGDMLQKSLAGLLRSLLYEIMSQFPDQIPIALPWRSRMFEYGDARCITWTVSELSEALERLVGALGDRSKVFFFVDGLDEFQGDESALLEIIDLFNTMAEYDHVKVCLSSRPWLVFEDAFHSRPTLQLQDLTRNDIATYVKAELEENKKFRLLQNQYFERCAGFKSEIVNKSSGVFLWVYLVVRSLLQGLRNEDRISDLQRRLQEIPADLEEYFRHMIKSLEPFYLQQAVAFFEIALKGPKTLAVYSFISEENPDYAILLAIGRFSDEEAQERWTVTRRRINGRCKGLLDVYQNNQYQNSRDPNYVPHKCHTFGVDFFHRTVRDFMTMPSTRKFIDEHRDEKFDANVEIGKATLAMIKRFDYDADELRSGMWACFMSAVYDVLGCAFRFETQNGTALVKILDEVERVIEVARYLDLESMVCDRDQRVSGRYGMLSSAVTYDRRRQFWMMIIAADLRLYIKTKLRQRQLSINDDGRPILDCVLRQGIYEYEKKYASENQLDHTPQAGLDIELISLVLDQGADPNEEWDKSTVWRHFLLKLFQQRTKVDCCNNIDTVWQIVRLLVEHGASLSQRLKIVENPSPWDNVPRPIGILSSIFGREKVRQLASSTKPRPNHSLKRNAISTTPQQSPESELYHGRRRVRQRVGNEADQGSISTSRKDWSTWK